MSTATAAAPVEVRPVARRPVPAIVERPSETTDRPTVLIVDGQGERRALAVHALRGLPAEIDATPTEQAATLRAHESPIAVLVVRAGYDPESGIELLKRLRATQPFVVSILVVERETASVREATADLGLFRLLVGPCRQLDLRTAVAEALRRHAEGASAIAGESPANPAAQRFQPER